MTADGRNGGRADWDRRQFLGFLAVSLVQSASPPVRQSADTLPGAGPSGKLYAPDWAGRPVEPVTAEDNLAAVQAIEKQLRCTCGCGLDIYTCRTTDFTCTYSPALHKEVLAQFNAGKTGRQIIADFVARYGEQALMAPPKEGFNWAGYLVPGFAVIVAGVLLTLVLRRWTREQQPQPAAAPRPVDATPDELARLQHELDRMDT